MCLCKGVTHLPSERLQLVEFSLLVHGLLLGKDGFIISLPGGDEVIEDTGELMSGVLDGHRRAVSCALTAVKIPQEGFVVVKRHRGETKGGGRAVFGFRFSAA